MDAPPSPDPFYDSVMDVITDHPELAQGTIEAFRNGEPSDYNPPSDYDPSNYSDESMTTMHHDPCVLLLGTCDTKLNELLYMKQQIAKDGMKVQLVDVGRTPSSDPAVDITNVILEYHRNKEDMQQPLESLSRDEYFNLMANACITLVLGRHQEKSIHGIVALGGSSGTSLTARIMRNTLPYGFPKIIVSTVASGDTSSYIGESDIWMVPSIVDIAGLNSLLRNILENAAAAMVAMAKTYYRRVLELEDSALSADPITGKLHVGITMFGVTTPGATAAIKYLTEAGCEVFVFHATGTGGQAMERLMDLNEGRVIDGVLDLTTTELADELVGGIMSAGPGRLSAAGIHEVPQVVSLGALDMVNYGPWTSVPERFKNRSLYQHNSNITLMRTTPEECKILGERIAERLKGYCKDKAKVEVWIPLQGISIMSEEGGPFYDKEADKALFAAVERGLDGTGIKLVKKPLAINDEKFAVGMAERLVEMMGSFDADLYADTA